MQEARPEDLPPELADMPWCIECGTKNKDECECKRSAPLTKFRKKPLEVEAIQYIGHGNFHERYEGQLPDWVWEAFESAALKPTNGDDPVWVRVVQGYPVLEPGFWLVRNVNGGLCVYSPDSFKATFDIAHNEPNPVDAEHDHVGNSADSAENSTCNLRADAERDSRAAFICPRCEMGFPSESAKHKHYMRCDHVTD